MTKSIFIAVTFMSLALTGCIFSSGSKSDSRNTYPDFQHIGGYVNGHWTKEHNPIVITGVPFVLPGDSLIIDSGVILEGLDLTAKAGSYLEIRGSASDPVLAWTRPALHSSVGWGGFIVSGKAKFSHMIGQSGIFFTESDSASYLQIDHSTFIHGRNAFQFFDSAGNPGVQKVHISIRNSIIAYPIDEFGSNSAVGLYTKTGAADTSLWTVDSNCFYTPGWVDVGNVISLTTTKGSLAAPAWPGNGNLDSTPAFVNYSLYFEDTLRWHRSDSVLITQVYDLHVKTGSPCAGMGAYAP